MSSARLAVRTAKLRHDAEEIYRPLRVSPRFSPWRSRLALPLEDQGEAVALAEEELELAIACESPRERGWRCAPSGSSPAARPGSR